jgi:hypothetical protein
VIQGQITLGALVAVVAAHKDLASPWKELLTYYQTMFDVKIKYEQTVAQFAPAGLVDEARETAEPPEGVDLGGRLRAQNLTIADESGEPILESLSFEVDLPTRLAIVGAGGGKEEIALALAGLVEPQHGRICVGAGGDTDLSRLPQSVLGRRLAYVGGGAYVFGGTLEDNLLYGLKHRPAGDAAPSGPAGRARERLEAERSGNSPFDPEADWVDWREAGVERPRTGCRRWPARCACRCWRATSTCWACAARPPSATATCRSGLLEARRAMQARLASDPRLARLVEHFDPAPTTRTRPWPRTCCSACRSTRGSTWPTSPPTRTCARPSTPRA